MVPLQHLLLFKLSPTISGVHPKQLSWQSTEILRGSHPHIVTYNMPLSVPALVVTFAPTCPQHLGKSGMYRNHSLNTALDTSKV